MIWARTVSGVEEPLRIASVKCRRVFALWAALGPQCRSSSPTTKPSTTRVRQGKKHQYKSRYTIVLWYGLTFGFVHLSWAALALLCCSLLFLLRVLFSLLFLPNSKR